MQFDFFLNEEKNSQTTPKDHANTSTPRANVSKTKHTENV